jgi:adenine-specific DNA-methyltransferase
VKLRVSGPFTVEAVQPPEINLGEVTQVISPIGGEPGDLEPYAPRRVTRVAELKNEFEVQNIEAYLTEMTRLLKGDGVRFPNNKEMVFSRLERISDGHGIHAEGRWVPRGDTDSDPFGDATVGVVFGPQYGPVTVQMLENVIKPAGRRYDDLVIAAFNFTAEVQDLAASPSHPKLKIHVAHIRPDVNPGMAGLLKERPGSQLFTVFGQPRTTVSGPNKNGEYTLVMEGVDVYNPVTNSITSTGAEKVAAWFLDSDYDGRTFCVTQAFFPDKSAWEKLAKALGGVVDADRFEALSGTTSLPFPKGKHKCAAVKVIDPRGNEVMQVHRLEGAK